MISAESARAQLAARLRRVHAAAISDAMDELGLERQCLDLAIKPLERSMRLVGPAFTVAFSAGVANGTDGPPNFNRMYRGCVVVVATGDDSVAGHWGDLFSVASQARGAAGVLVDGGLRDSNIHMGMANWPVFSRYLSPIGPKGGRQLHSVEEPVEVCGASGQHFLVHPGDWVVGDMDGVVVIPAARVDEVTETAEVIERTNDQIRTDLATGAEASAVFGKHRRL